MDDQKKTTENNDARQHQPNVLPATEVPRNPNPRANANLVDEPSEEEGPTTGVGSEITDGEDA